MPAKESYLNGFPKMKPSNSNPESELRPEDYPLGSQESRAAARAVLEATKQPKTLEEVLLEARPPMSAQDYIEKAERLAETARPGDKLTAGVIAACKRMAQYAREKAKASEAKSDAHPESPAKYHIEKFGRETR